MLVVAGKRCPFKVFGTVICFDSIQMIDRLPVASRRQKCFRDQPMDCLLSAIAK